MLLFGHQKSLFCIQTTTILSARRSKSQLKSAIFPRRRPDRHFWEPITANFFRPRCRFFTDVVAWTSKITFLHSDNQNKFSKLAKIPFQNDNFATLSIRITPKVAIPMSKFAFMLLFGHQLWLFKFWKMEMFTKSRRKCPSKFKFWRPYQVCSIKSSTFERQLHTILTNKQKYWHKI